MRIKNDSLWRVTVCGRREGASHARQSTRGANAGAGQANSQELLDRDFVEAP
jgi:hypothetical protein